MVACAAMVGTPDVGLAWDNEYGEQNDTRSFSAVQAVLARPGGGVVVAGWFWGTFEGKTSPNGYRSFVMSVDATGARQWIVDYPFLSPDGEEPTEAHLFRLAPAADGAVWVNPGPTGGLALVSEAGVLAEPVDQDGRSRINRSSDSMVVLSGSGNVVDVRGLNGELVLSIDPEALLTGEGIVTKRLGVDVAVDDAGITVVTRFIETFPFANWDVGIFRLTPSGDVEWSTIIDRENSVDYVFVGTTNERLTLRLSDDVLTNVSLATGAISEVPVQVDISLCSTAGSTTLVPAVAGVCPEGTTKWRSSDSFDVEPPELLRGRSLAVSTADDVMYEIYEFEDESYSGAHPGLPGVGRWRLDGSMWRLDAVWMPFGLEPALGNTLWSTSVNSAGNAVIGGSLNRGAAFGATSRARGTERLYSAAVATRVLRSIPGGRPSAPRSVSARRTASGTVKVSWDKPRWTGGLRLRDYVVYRRVNDGRWRRVADPVSTRRTVTVPGASPGDRISVRVVAVNAAGKGVAGRLTMTLRRTQSG